MPMGGPLRLRLPEDDMMAPVTMEPTWQLGLALVLLVALTLAVSWAANLRIGRQTVVAAIRAIIQLAAVSVIIVAALQHLWSALAFVLVMFVIGVYTTGKRVGVLHCWPWVALAMAAGTLPVLLIVYLTGTAPLNGLSLIPIAGIVIGNMMTAHTLVVRNSFTHLRSHLGQYEAGLSLGFPRPRAIRLADPDSARDATMPNNDQTRTVGLVTLPGAFIGVLLGGGSPVQAGAAQVLVLLGIMAGQAVTVSVAHRLIEHARIVTPELRLALHR
jgi:putative ABC transport system permease protein